MFVIKAQGMEHFMLDCTNGEAVRIQGHRLHTRALHSDIRLATGLYKIRKNFSNGKLYRKNGTVSVNTSSTTTFGSYCCWCNHSFLLGLLPVMIRILCVPIETMLQIIQLECRVTMNFGRYSTICRKAQLNLKHLHADDVNLLYITRDDWMLSWAFYLPRSPIST